MSNEWASIFLALAIHCQVALKLKEDDFRFLTQRRPDMLGAIPAVVLLPSVQRQPRLRFKTGSYPIGNILDSAFQRNTLRPRIAL